MCVGNSNDDIVKIIDFGMAVSLWDRAEHYEDKLVGRGRGYTCIQHIMPHILCTLVYIIIFYIVLLFNTL